MCRIWLFLFAWREAWREWFSYWAPSRVESSPIESYGMLSCDHSQKKQSALNVPANDIHNNSLYSVRASERASVRERERERDESEKNQPELESVWPDAFAQSVYVWSRTNERRTHTNDINLIRLLEMNAIHEIIYHSSLWFGHTTSLAVFVVVIVFILWCCVFLLENIQLDVCGVFFSVVYIYFFLFYWLHTPLFLFCVGFSILCACYLFGTLSISLQCVCGGFSSSLVQMITIGQFTSIECIANFWEREIFFSSSSSSLDFFIASNKFSRCLMRNCWLNKYPLSFFCAYFFPLLVFFLHRINWFEASFEILRNRSMSRWHGNRAEHTKTEWTDKNNKRYQWIQIKYFIIALRANVIWLILWFIFGRMQFLSLLIKSISMWVKKRWNQELFAVYTYFIPFFISFFSVVLFCLIFYYF